MIQIVDLSPELQLGAVQKFPLWAAGALLGEEVSLSSHSPI